MEKAFGEADVEAQASEQAGEGIKEEAEGSRLKHPW